MFPVMNSASKLNGIAFCVMLCLMFLYSLPAVVDFSKRQDSAQSLELFLDGKLLRKFEQSYDKQIFIRDPSVKLWASTQFLLFKEGARGVVMGEDGWLYTNQEYLVPNDLSHNLENQVNKVVAVQALLKQHNKQLLLMPVPMKVDIYAGHTRYAPDPRSRELYAQFSDSLQARDVRVANIRDAFVAQHQSTELFLKTDTHWSPDGARLAAQELARQNPQLIGEQPYVSKQTEEKALKGDLMNYLQFDPSLAPELFVPTQIALYETTNPNQQVSEASLFGEKPQHLALVGSSYSKIDDWNFVGFLKEALQNDLVSVAVEARGPFQAMEDFTNSDLLSNPDIQTVIWEFPLRTVLAQRAGDKSWQAAQPQPL
jgi:alginate O-acetyltransferase complex protein AlgJ